jgi:sugar phosphate isomerase/epimerase/Asp-tRNA(Asn)/Glu-tRNA(Gln) amidotransferase C subunit
MADEEKQSYAEMQKKKVAGEWDKLWKELDSTQPIPTFHDYHKQDGSYTKEGEEAEKKFVTKNIKSSDFGIGAAMMGKYADPLQGLQAEIRGGASHIEFSPSINQGQGFHSFTKISAEKREALKELRKVNKVTMTTHAHAGVTGLTGFDERSYSFNDQSRQHSIDEIKKAIDFAADVAEGGAITFHAGDFARPMAGQKMGNNGEEFMTSADEKDNIVLAVIDKETKSRAEAGTFRTGQKFMTPILDKNTKNWKTPYGFDKDFKLPQVERIDGSIKTKEFDTFQEYAGWLIKNDADFREDVVKSGKDPEELLKVVKDAKNNDKLDASKEKVYEVNDYYILEKAAARQFKDKMLLKLSQNANDITRSMNTQESEITEVEKALKVAKDESKEKGIKLYIPKAHRARQRGDMVTEQEKNTLMQRERLSDDDFIVVENGVVYGGGKDKEDTFIQTFYAGVFDVNHIQDRIGEIDTIKESQKSAIKQEYNKLINDSKYTTVSEFAKEQNEKSFGQLGIELYEKNKILQKRQEAKGEKVDQLYFAVENLFPDKFGSTPAELLQVIDQARGAMAKELEVKYSKSKSEAKKIAEDSIKATFDTGHFNMWRKNFKRQDGEDDASFDKRFKNWSLTETEKLIKAKVIGNIHLADNTGYDDDHVTVGQGNVPVKELMKMLDEARGRGDVVGKISVEGFDDSGERHGVHEAWKASGASIFRAQQATDAWTNPGSSGGSGGGYFSKSENYSTGFYTKPSFMFGKYVPDREEWAPWSDTTLE